MSESFHAQVVILYHGGMRVAASFFLDLRVFPFSHPASQGVSETGTLSTWHWKMNTALAPTFYVDVVVLLVGSPNT